MIRVNMNPVKNPYLKIEYYKCELLSKGLSIDLGQQWSNLKIERDVELKLEIGPEEVIIPNKISKSLIKYLNGRIDYESDCFDFIKKILSDNEQSNNHPYSASEDYLKIINVLERKDRFKSVIFGIGRNLVHDTLYVGQFGSKDLFINKLGYLGIYMNDYEQIKRMYGGEEKIVMMKSL